MSRDDQFAGFAKSLVWEVINNDDAGFDTTDKFIAAWEQTIARRAYNLARHTLEACSKQHRDYGMEPEIDMSTIPDMPTWPEEASE